VAPLLAPPAVRVLLEAAVKSVTWNTTLDPRPSYLWGEMGQHGAALPHLGRRRRRRPPRRRRLAPWRRAVREDLLLCCACGPECLYGRRRGALRQQDVA
jgi:hypothetical protein